MTDVPAPVPVSGFEPGDLGLTADPYDQLAQLRRQGPVVRLASGFVAVVGHDAVLEVLRHPSASSGPIALRYTLALPPGAARDELSHRINFLDPPDHPRVRGLVASAFTPRRVAALRPFMERTTEALLDDLLASGDGRDGPVDLQHRFAHQLPSLVISELLGVPAGERDHLTALADAVTPLLGVQVDAGDRSRAIEAAEEMHDRLGSLLDERTACPADDLLSALLTAEQDGERLARVELLSLAATLYSAGHRTTRDLTTNGLSVLLRRPDLRAELADGRLPPAAVVTEMLRFETPTLFVARIPSGPMAVAGLDVGPTDPLLVFLGSANRDAAAYPAPDVFDPHRWLSDPQPPTPLSFAFGAHYCLGASLARLEVEVMVGQLLRRLPNVELATDELLWRQRGPFRSLDGLPVLLGV
jgi:cytochrome P450